MNYLLDTGILIRALRGRRDFTRFLREMTRDERIAVATVSRTELFAGVRINDRHTTRRLLSRFINLPLTPQIADRAGTLIKAGRENNHPIQLPDATIAATALIHNLSLVTLNTKDFVHVNGLSLYPHDLTS